jgi:peptidoglycan biosynthesis protein MviN/MurJ (putative lipid II flippase)
MILTVSAILFNIWFIPKMGMEGAAYASLFSSLIYTLLLLALIRWKLKTTPFHKNQSYVILIVLGLYLLSLVWDNTISKMMVQLPMKLINAQVIDGFIKTTLLLSLGMYTIIKMKISPEMNAVLNKFYQKYNVRKG